MGLGKGDSVLELFDKGEVFGETVHFSWGDHIDDEFFSTEGFFDGLGGFFKLKRIKILFDNVLLEFDGGFIM